MGASSREKQGLKILFFFAHFLIITQAFFSPFINISWGSRVSLWSAWRYSSEELGISLSTPIPLVSFQGNWNTRCDTLHGLILSFFLLFIFLPPFPPSPHLFLLPSFLLFSLNYFTFFHSSCYLSAFLSSLFFVPYFPPLILLSFPFPFHLLNFPLPVSFSALP